jgi:hypothetical protein
VVPAEVKNVTIRDGNIGLSATGGIHTINANNLTFTNLIIKDYERSAIYVEGGRGIIISDMNIARSRHDVPVNSLWNAGRYILPYLEHLVEKRNSHVFLNVMGIKKSAKDIYHALLEA